MPAGTLALLASALLHAGWNALLKRERQPETAVLGVLAVALAAATAAAAALPGPAFSSAAAIAGYHLCYGRALALGGTPAPVFAVALAVALPLVAWSAHRRSGATVPWRPPGARQVLAGLLCTASFLLFLVGLARSGAGPALTLRNTSVVFAQGLAALMGEPVPRRQLLGAVLVAAGAAVLAWG